MLLRIVSRRRQRGADGLLWNDVNRLPAPFPALKGLLHPPDQLFSLGHVALPHVGAVLPEVVAQVVNRQPAVLVLVEDPGPVLQ